MPTAGIVAGLPTLVRAGYMLFRLPRAVIPGVYPGTGEAKAWYQGLCAAYGLSTRVMLGESQLREPHCEPGV